MSGQDFYTHPEDSRRTKHDFYTIERFRDFMEWLFDPDNKDGVDWMTQSEAWELFEKWEERQPKNT